MNLGAVCLALLYFPKQIAIQVGWIPVFDILCSSSLAAAHMEMSWPYPLRSRFDPNSNPSLIDYSMTSPLDPHGSTSRTVLSVLTLSNECA